MSEGKEIMPETFSMRITDINPSQLYIAEGKYQYWHNRLTGSGIEDYPAIPVKKIGRDIFFTDGHSQALALWQNGSQDITVYHDPDPLDWILYLVDLQWCRQQHITSIADLQNRIISDTEFAGKWLQRCAEKQARLASDPLQDMVIGFETSPDRKQAICAEILPALPDWFGIEDAIRNYVETVSSLPFITITLYGKVVGFCALKINFAINVDLYVLGIFQEFHGRSIGRQLIRFIEGYCRKEKFPYMTVKTLSERHLDPAYRKTRKFYESMGFRALEEFPDLWGKENPCLYMIKAVEI